MYNKFCLCILIATVSISCVHTSVDKQVTKFKSNLTSVLEEGVHEPFQITYPKDSIAIDSYILEQHIDSVMLAIGYHVIAEFKEGNKLHTFYQKDNYIGFYQARTSNLKQECFAVFEKPKISFSKIFAQNFGLDILVVKDNTWYTCDLHGNILSSNSKKENENIIVHYQKNAKQKIETWSNQELYGKLLQIKHVEWLLPSQKSKSFARYNYQYEWTPCGTWYVNNEIDSVASVLPCLELGKEMALNAYKELLQNGEQQIELVDINDITNYCQNVKLVPNSFWLPLDTMIHISHNDYVDLLPELAIFRMWNNFEHFYNTQKKEAIQFLNLHYKKDFTLTPLTYYPFISSLRYVIGKASNASLKYIYNMAKPISEGFFKKRSDLKSHLYNTCKTLLQAKKELDYFKMDKSEINWYGGTWINKTVSQEMFDKLVLKNVNYDNEIYYDYGLLSWFYSFWYRRELYNNTESFEYILTDFVQTHETNNTNEETFQSFYNDKNISIKVIPEQEYHESYANAVVNWIVEVDNNKSHTQHATIPIKNGNSITYPSKKVMEANPDLSWNYFGKHLQNKWILIENDIIDHSSYTILSKKLKPIFLESFYGIPEFSGNGKFCLNINDATYDNFDDSRPLAILTLQKLEGKNNFVETEVLKIPLPKNHFISLYHWLNDNTIIMKCTSMLDGDSAKYMHMVLHSKWINKP